MEWRRSREHSSGECRRRVGGLAPGKVRGEECRLWSTLLGQKAESGGRVMAIAWRNLSSIQPTRSDWI